MASPAAFRPIIERLSDWRWRLDNLYWITDKEGCESKFRLNWAQEALFRSMHFLCVILKARQLGFSTFILVFMLDVCLFNANRRCGIVDVKMDDAKKKLEKIKFAYKRLPAWLKQAVPVTTANATTIEFANGSSIEVGTSHRGGTLQYLHVSELGKIAAKYPEKAREIRTGALNTVQAGQVVWIESTAEGQEGDFFDLCQTAQAKQRMGAPLTALDFKFFFFPWWKAPEYTISPDGVIIPKKFAEYFQRLKKEHQITLTAGQMAWYVKKAETQLDDMKREYPSTPEEAFEASVEGAIFGPQMEAAELDGRIGRFPAIPGIPVHTFWDIGRRDYTSIWFCQILLEEDGLPRIRVVGFYQNCLTGMPHYVERCFGTEHAQKHFPQELFAGGDKGLFAENGWKRGFDFFPHDAKVIEWGSNRSRIEQLNSAGFNPKLGTELSLHDGINASRATLGVCEFDEEATTEGRKVLKNYRWEWDDKLGAWKTGTERHDVNSHGAAAFRTLGTSWREIVPEIVKPKPKDHHVLEVKNGVLTSNMSVMEIINMKKRKREANG